MIWDNTAEFREALAACRARALEEMGALAAEAAREGAPVRTGRLRDSVECRVGSEAAEVGSSLEYALFVELEQPFLRPAVEGRGEAFRGVIEGVLTGEGE